MLMAMADIAFAQMAPPFSNSQISSDFGPRNLVNKFFHGGLDYAAPAGSSIESIEPGEVVWVRGNDGDQGGWRMAISGDQSNRVFHYMHMFTNGAGVGAVSGDFRIGRDAATGRYFIQRISDGKIFIGQHQAPGQPLIRGTAVIAREAVGPVGDSGAAAGHSHLHLQLGTSGGGDLDNPFVLVQSAGANYAVTISKPPSIDYVIRVNEESNYAFRFRVNSLAGLNLDAVQVSLDGISLAAPSDVQSPKASFRYGGRVGEDRTTSAATPAGENAGSLPVALGAGVMYKVDPQSNGVDDFVIDSLDLSGLSEGPHTLSVNALTVSGQPSPASGVTTTFIVSRTPPTLTIQSGQGALSHGAITADTWITITAQKTIAPVKSIEVYKDGGASPYKSVAAASLSGRFDGKAWYWVRACDTAINCVDQAFGIFGPNDTPPAAPPPPGAPPGGKRFPPPGYPPNQPPPTPQPPYPPPTPSPDWQTPSDTPAGSATGPSRRV
jgi:hypothetical protein